MPAVSLMYGHMMFLLLHKTIVIKWTDYCITNVMLQQSAMERSVTIVCEIEVFLCKCLDVGNQTTKFKYFVCVSVYVSICLCVCVCACVHSEVTVKQLKEKIRDLDEKLESTAQVCRLLPSVWSHSNKSSPSCNSRPTQPAIPLWWT